MTPIRRRALGIGFSALALALIGCDRDLPTVLRPGEPGPVIAPERDLDALFQTDSLSYTLSENGFYTAKIGIEFTNRTATTLYIANCNRQSAVHLEKLVNGEWKWAWTAIIPSCASRPIVVEPNATYQPAVLFYAGMAGTNVGSQFEVYPIDGVYRFVWTTSPAVTVVETFSTENLVPHAQRVSNRFALRTRSGT